MPQGFDAAGINDSKQVSRPQREILYERITASANYAVIIIPVEEVDRLNILQATLLAMSEALRMLNPQAESGLIDGNRMPPDPPCPVQTVIKGDSQHAAIAAASIIAKVTRDRWMTEASQQYPGYGFERHFGYYNKQHIAALNELGPCPLHRQSFEPIKSWVNQPQLF